MMRPVQQTAATVLGWLDEGRDFAAGTVSYTHLTLPTKA